MRPDSSRTRGLVCLTPEPWLHTRGRWLPPPPTSFSVCLSQGWALLSGGDLRAGPGCYLPSLA